MKRFLISLVLLAVMVIPSVTVSAAKNDYSYMIGVKQPKGNNVDVTYTGKHFKNNKGIEQYEYVARIQQAPIYNDDGTAVDCSWHLQSGIKGGVLSYSIINNVFSANVVGSAISTTYHGQTMSWNPVVMVDSKQYTAKKEPTLLAVDPINSNYRNNVLEWDYQVCTRRVRVIEGMIQETWIFDKDPKGTVWIKDNTQKTAGFTYAIAPYAYDANGSAIPINQYKQVMATDLAKAVYPVTIDPTEVFDTSASDGYMDGAGSIYNIAYNLANAGNIWAGNWDFSIGQYFNGVLYFIFRAFCFFDTSILPDLAIITAANISLYGENDWSDTDFNISITNGQPTYPSDPLVLTDFDITKYSGRGTIGFNTVGFTTGGYNNISLNSSGMGWINKSGITKLLVANANSLDGIAPVGNEGVSVWAKEKGAGYQPYLEVTYTVSAAPTVVTYSPATSITETSAVANGSITENNSNVITSYGIAFDLAPNAIYTNAGSHTDADKLGNFSFPLSPLLASSLYYYRAFATNVLGTSYGIEYTFTTNASVVTTVVTNPATNIFVKAARINGYLNNDGGETTTTQFRWYIHE